MSKLIVLDVIRYTHTYTAMGRQAVLQTNSLVHVATCNHELLLMRMECLSLVPRPLPVIQCCTLFSCDVKRLGEPGDEARSV